MALIGVTGHFYGPDGEFLGLWVDGVPDVEGAVLGDPPPPPAPPVPQVVSRFQARAALFNAGLLAQVDTVVAGSDPLTQMAWTDAQEFRRDSPTIAALASQIGLAPEQIDDLFRSAAQISA